MRVEGLCFKVFSKVRWAHLSDPAPGANVTSSRLWGYRLGFRVGDSEIRVWGLGFGVEGLLYRVGLGVHGSRLGVLGLVLFGLGCEIE